MKCLFKYNINTTNPYVILLSSSIIVVINLFLFVEEEEEDKMDNDLGRELGLAYTSVSYSLLLSFALSLVAGAKTRPTTSSSSAFENNNRAPTTLRLRGYGCSAAAPSHAAVLRLGFF